MPEKKKTPTIKVRDGTISIAGWENESKEGRPFISFRITKSYKKDDKWHETESLTQIDLLKLRSLVEKAYDAAQLVMSDLKSGGE